MDDYTITDLTAFITQFNAVALRGFDAIHFDMLMAIAAKVRDGGDATVVITFDELRALAGVEDTVTDEQFLQTLWEANWRFLDLNFRIEDDREIVQFVLFTTFATNEYARTLEVRANPEFAFLLDSFTARFTGAELHEYVHLRSRYAKECYRRCKQHRAEGVWRVDRDEFCRLMNVPEASQHTAALQQRVLLPIEAELGPLIGLRVEKICSWPQGTPHRGRKPITGFVFHFTTDHDPAVIQH